MHSFCFTLKYTLIYTTSAPTLTPLCYSTTSFLIHRLHNDEWVVYGYRYKEGSRYMFCWICAKFCMKQRIRRNARLKLCNRQHKRFPKTRFDLCNIFIFTGKYVNCVYMSTKKELFWINRRDNIIWLSCTLGRTPKEHWKKVSAVIQRLLKTFTDTLNCKRNMAFFWLKCSQILSFNINLSAYKNASGCTVLKPLGSIYVHSHV